MKKQYKLIVIIYFLFCVSLIIYSLIPKNPVVGEKEEISLLPEVKKNDYFSNYELNFIYSNNIDTSKYINGRNINYFNYDDRYFILDNNYYYKEQLNGNEKLNAYYFSEDNYILVKAEIPFREYMNNSYYFDLGTMKSKIVEMNVSYNYDDSDYMLPGINYGPNDTFELTHKPNTRFTSTNSIVTVSFFIKLYEKLDNNTGYLTKLYKIEQKKNQSINIGLNTIKYQDYYYEAQVISHYLEIGGI